MGVYDTSIQKLTTALKAVFVKKTDIADNLTTTDATKVLSAKQGKELADMIGSAITYINK